MKNNQQGFTLIELLFVVTLIGILASIALPQYNTYRAKAFDVRAQSDLRNVAIAEEVHFLETEGYLSCDTQSCLALSGIAALSKGVTLSIAATATGFSGQSQHAKGSGKVFKWDSSKGGMLNE